MNNLLKRTLTALVFGAVMVCGTIFSPIVCGALMLVAGIVAMKEFFGISIGQSLGLQQKLAVLVMFLMLLFSLEICRGHIDGTCIKYLFFAPLLFGILVSVSAIFRKDHTDFRNLAYIMAGFLYIGLPVGLSPFLMYNDGFDGFRFLSFFVIIWGSDVGAYALGSTLGQLPGAHRLAPQISPKKSWWGFVGAVVLGTAAAFLVRVLGWVSLSVLATVGLGLTISVFAVAGDLVESLWKRNFGVKDSGNCIPGHGGMLDRFDSSLVAIPLAAFYLSIIC